MPLMPGAQDVVADRKGGGAARSPESAPAARTTSTGRTAAASCTGALGPTLYTAAPARSCFAAPARRRDEARLPAAHRPGVSLSMELAADKPPRHDRADRRADRDHGGADGGVIDDGVIVISRRPHRRGRAARRDADPGRRAHGRRWPARPSSPASSTPTPTAPQGDDDLVPQQNWSRSRISRSAPPPSTTRRSRERDLRRAEMQRAGHILGAAHLFDRRDRLWRRAAQASPDRHHSFDDALAHVRRLKAQGAHSVKNYNQPRREPAPAGDRRGRRGEHAGRGRGRLAVRPGHDPDRRRQFDARAQYPADDVLRRCGQLLRRSPGHLHPDAGGDLRRPGRRSLLARADRRVGAIRC